MAVFVIGAGALAGAVAAGWHSMSPVSQLYGKTFTGAAPGRTPSVCFTFDDGPNDPCTGRLLEVLARHSVRATFFMIGRYVAAHPGIARMVADAGHEIGNHTFSHPNLIFSSPAGIRREITECRAALEDAGIAPAPYFRPPYGARRPDVLSAVAAAGLKTVMWRVSSFDWKLRSSTVIVSKIHPKLRGGEVILMHDGSHTAFGTDRSATIGAVDELISRFGVNGITVGEMIRAECG
jgi:peptidoglycan/xylan/chitin deacetylase (PgdA/CDA1 family)